MSVSVEGWLCPAAAVCVSAVEVEGIRVITARIVPLEDDGKPTTSYGSVVTVQGDAMDGQLTTRTPRGWKAITFGHGKFPPIDPS